MGTCKYIAERSYKYRKHRKLKLTTQYWIGIEDTSLKTWVTIIQLDKQIMDDGY